MAEARATTPQLLGKRSLSASRQRGNRSQNSKSKGDALEQRVALYYEAMGYQVDRDVSLLGHQIDLVAIRHLPGVGAIRIGIEVKSRGKTLGVRDVTGFIRVGQHLLSKGTISAAVLVTDATVTRPARLSVEGEPHIKLLTLNNLEHHLFNTAEALLKVVNDYEQRPIFHSYYALAASTATSTRNDVSSHIQSWACPGAGSLILIGDFGSGKSTILERVFYAMAKRRVSDPNSQFPILLRLRGLRRFSDLWRFIEASLRDTQYISPPRSVFDHELEEGRLILLLDGFDEIYSGATAKDRADYLTFLSPLLKSKSPVILSSRPTFFESFNDLIASIYKLHSKADQFERLPDFGINEGKMARVFGAAVDTALRRSDFSNVLVIKQLDRAQIRHVLEQQSSVIKNSLGMSIDQFEAYLYSIYDLEDLMSRPLLLDMIIGTITSKAIDITRAKTVTASTLYEVYTQQAAFRDRKRAVHDELLTPQTRLAACRELARAMLNKGDIVLTAPEVEQAVRRALSASRETHAEIDIPRAVTDVRTCSFLRFSGENGLVFAHKSFYEFFIAQSLFLASRESTDSFFSYSRRPLSGEIIYFLACFARDHDLFALFLSSGLRGHRNSRDRSLLYSLAFAFGEALENAKLVGGSIDGITLARSNIRSAHIDSVRITGSKMRRVNCTDWILSTVALEGCFLTEVEMRSCKWTFTSNASTFEQSRLIGCELHISGKNLSFSDVAVEDCNIFLNCPLVLTGCRLNRGLLTLGSQTIIYSDRSTLTEVTLACTTEHLWYGSESRLDFVGCTFRGLRFSGLDIFKSKQKYGHAKGQITLRDCRGIVYLETTGELESEGLAHELIVANPQLFIVPITRVNQIRVFLEQSKQDHQSLRRTRSGRRVGAISTSIQMVGKDGAKIANRRVVSLLQEELEAHMRKWQLNETDLPQLLRDMLTAVRSLKTDGIMR